MRRRTKLEQPEIAVHKAERTTSTQCDKATQNDTQNTPFRQYNVNERMRVNAHTRTHMHV